MPIDIPAFAYAATIISGGIYGYVKSKSIPSLGAGLLFGSILGYGAIKISQNPADMGVLFTASSVLGGLMGYRYYSTGKIMPAGIICLLSTVMVGRLAVMYVSAKGGDHLIRVLSAIGWWASRLHPQSDIVLIRFPTTYPILIDSCLFAA
ncbi:hypothetical protein KM043_004912 [Ampulex compressa]|nr:hypothetical protein KM043_004912 [Ampulex compressa]